MRPVRAYATRGSGSSYNQEMHWEYRVEALWARVGELADRMNDGGNAAGSTPGIVLPTG